MKKYISIIMLAVAIMAIVAIGAKAESFVYSTTISTNVLGLGGNVTADKADIKLATVRIKQIVVHQPTTTAQTVWVYDNWTSTTAATKVDTYYIPGTAGNYPLYGTGILSTRANDNADIINMPYFAIRTSTNAAVLNGLGCTVTVLYGK